MPGYHTGPAGYLGYLLGARHSHLDNAGYNIDQKNLASGIEPTAKDLVDQLVREEGWRQVLASLVVCFFSRGLYTPDAIVESLATLGIDLDKAELRDIGADILRRKNRFKLREGFDPSALPIPNRILETASPSGPISDALLREALRQFSEQISGSGRTR
ncbi:aldehyde ferredoxin oxidoreductase C-terminal domain-containing protein [Candidatus Bipolaricaulota bacterium]